MDYIIVSYDSVNQITVIQVTGCAKTTSIDVSKVPYNGDAYNVLLEQVAKSVLDAMNPSSVNYDPILVGS